MIHQSQLINGLKNKTVLAYVILSQVSN